MQNILSPVLWNRGFFYIIISIAIEQNHPTYDNIDGPAYPPLNFHFAFFYAKKRTNMHFKGKTFGSYKFSS